MKWLITFIVSGRLTFPVDMLRYDGCWPTSQEAVGQLCLTLDPILRRHARNEGEVARVQLSTYARIKDWKPTKDRWESFGWTVDESSIRVCKL